MFFNKKNYWFKDKKNIIVPISYEGYITIIIYILLIGFSLYKFIGSNDFYVFFLEFTLITTLLTMIIKKHTKKKLLRL